MSDRTLVIAEIGINHNGDLGIAKRLIDAAAVAGADAVKFQKRSPELCVPPDQRGRLRDTPWGEMTYLAYRHRIEFGATEYDEIDRHCRDAGIEWFASVWDLESLAFVLGYTPRKLKIPSAMLTHRELLRAAAETGVHCYISTGMSTLEEVDAAVAIFRDAGCPFTLMHCNSSYPASNAELNLRCMDTLRRRYGCEVGYSGHEFGLIPTVAAVALGAAVVERHITLRRSLYGSDQKASVEPVGLIKLVNFIRTVEEARGDGIKRVYDSELAAREKLRWVEEGRPRRRPARPAAAGAQIGRAHV